MEHAMPFPKSSRPIYISLFTDHFICCASHTTRIHWQHLSCFTSCKLFILFSIYTNPCGLHSRPTVYSLTSSFGKWTCNCSWTTVRAKRNWSCVWPFHYLLLEQILNAIAGSSSLQIISAGTICYISRMLLNKDQLCALSKVLQSSL